MPNKGSSHNDKEKDKKCKIDSSAQKEKIK